MFNRLLIVLFCAGITIAIGGCGGGSGSDEGSASSSTSSQTADTGSDDSSAGADSTSDDTNASDESGDDSTAADDASGNSNPSDVLDGGASHITDVSVQNYGTAESSGKVDVTFGQVFADGDVGAKQHVVAVADGQALPTQLDRKASWSDGSLRHGVITVQLKAPANGEAQTLALYSVDGNVDLGVGDVSLSELLGTSFSAKVKLKLDGTTYTANARNALEQVAQSGSCPAWEQQSCKRWLTGGLASEWIVPAALTSGSDTAPRLRVFFNVRAYRAADGSISNVRVDSVIENDLTYDVSPSDESYDAKITVGTSSYSAADITHYTQARWHRVLWSDGDPTMYVKPNVAYLQSSRAISKYADVSPTDGLLDDVAQSATPMEHVDQTKDMGSTGAQAGIGPLPRWTSAFVVSGDRRAFNWMLANDDGVGSYAFHYRDDDTGRPLTIVDHPYVTIANINSARRSSGAYQDDLLPSCGGDCSSPYRFEIAHQPSIGYVPYLVTGDFYYLEEMQFEASYDELWTNPGYRDYEKGRLIRANPQVRGQAWTLRAISDAAFATPDGDPLKAYFVNQIDYIVNDYVSHYVDDSASHPLHVLDESQGVNGHVHGLANVGIAPWQQDFFNWAVGHAAAQQVPNAEKLLKWTSKFQVGRMTSAAAGSSDGFCWLEASGYVFQIRDTPSSDQYDDLTQLYTATYPDVAGLKCNSQAMVNEISSSGDNVKIGEMVGYSSSPTGFPSNLQIGLAAAANSGIDKADEAWSRFANRTVQPDYSNYSNFAVVPR